MAQTQTTWWYVGCEQWASGKITHEKDAKAQAEDLDKNATCSNEHFYWASAETPTYNTKAGRQNIPEDARRP